MRPWWTSLGGRQGVGGGTGLVVISLRHDPLPQEFLLACGVLLGVVVLGGVAREVGLGLLQGGLERPLVNRKERLALLNILAFLEVNGRQDARDLRLDGRRLVGLARPERAELHRGRLLDHGRHRDRHGLALARSRRRRLVLLEAAGHQDQSKPRDDHGQRGRRPASPGRSPATPGRSPALDAEGPDSFHVQAIQRGCSFPADQGDRHGRRSGGSSTGSCPGAAIPRRWRSDPSSR